MDEQLLSKIKKLFDQKLGSRAIAKQLKITRYQVQKAYKELGIYNSGRKTPKQSTPKEKTCNICNKTKKISSFRKRAKNNKTSYECYCLSCEQAYNKKSCKKRYKNNTQEYRNYYIANKEKKKLYNKQYHKKNQDKLKKYRQARKEQDRKNLKLWIRHKRKQDPCFKLRNIISNSIARMLKKNKSNKKGESCLQKLGYSFKDLKNHLEKQFKSWMTWENHGRYDANTWDDNNLYTWTWQVDHIIPQSDLPYDSMNHPNFQKCWSLNNLRPLNAKQNLMDGACRIRHVNNN